MKFVQYQDCKSPHQLPLARELLRLFGVDNFRFVYRDADQAGRASMGWKMGGADEPWQLYIGSHTEESRELIENAEVLLTGMREIDLFERRAAKGLKTFYQTERWFKPIVGILRLIKPSYFRMARRLVALLQGGNRFRYMPIGIHAARDMARLCGLMHGDLRCLFRAPKLGFERKPGGRIFSRVERVDRVEWEKKYCLDKMRMWGYFVEPSKFKGTSSAPLANQLTHSQLTIHNSIRVLWVGRLLHLKRVDTIIRAVGELFRARLTTNDYRLTTTLDIYGTGPEESRLKRLAAKYGDCIKFHPPVPIDMVRKLMRSHDVYVFASDGHDGWGAVVSEALVEGMRVVGTYEAGSGATMLPDECLFRAGDWQRLACLLRGAASELAQGEGIGAWSVEEGAKYMFAAIKV